MTSSSKGRGSKAKRFGNCFHYENRQLLVPISHQTAIEINIFLSKTHFYKRLHFSSESRTAPFKDMPICCCQILPNWAESLL